jgi:dephospho-CoA kinase
MLNLLKVAITGILACGKSTAAQSFQLLGARVVSADALVHELIATDQTVRQQILELLDDDVLLEGQLNRKRIAERVFENPEKLSQLEAILHPRVEQATNIEYEKAASDPSIKLFVSEIPLFFESDPSGYDVVITVTATESACRKRFGNDEEFDRRMSRQLSQDEKASRADIVIENNGTAEELQQKIRETFAQLTEQIS